MPRRPDDRDPERPPRRPRGGADRSASTRAETERAETERAETERAERARADFRENLGRAVIPPVLYDPDERERLGLEGTDGVGRYVVELNLFFADGLQAAADRFERLFADTLGADRPDAAAPERQCARLSKSYFLCEVTFDEAQALVAADLEQARDAGGGTGAAARQARGRGRSTSATARASASSGAARAAAGDVEEEVAPRRRTIYKLWPDFPVMGLVDRSIPTIKADAAHRAYEATGEGIVWAVVDSGIDVRHPHFGAEEEPARHTLLEPSVAELHRDFTVLAPPTRAPGAVHPALTDPFGHGTHVAGIIAGGLSPDTTPDAYGVFEHVHSEQPGEQRRRIVRRRVRGPEVLRGVAPRCRLVSLRVLDERGAGHTSNIIRALQYIREEVNGDPKLLRVHGVNLSVGYEFDAEMFACGQSPLCVEVDRLVRSGVVVVVAAGNTGYARITAQARTTKVGLSSTINDPGNAALAITVGATHRDSPHTYGVSYFSSKGPTGDGRLKPDLVAPGERVTSCAAGTKLTALGLSADGARYAAYVDDSGTSLAAPHVSGAIAAFLSIRREFILRPEEVKRIFLESATPLGRERYFEGHGLVDLMRAIQSV